MPSHHLLLFSLLLPASSLAQSPAQMSAGDGFGCTVRDDSLVVCQGFNYWGQVGDGSTLDRANPKFVVNADGSQFKASQVSCGSTHSCALQAGTGKVWCWGSTTAGEVGLDPSLPTTPLQAQVSPNLVAPDLIATKVCAGQQYSCAIRASDKILTCWGSNAYGVLGRESTTGVAFGTPRASPSPIPGVGAVLDVACGNMHVCYIADDGKRTLGCNGFDNWGQIPSGDFWNVDADPIWSATNIASVAAGMWHTCVVTTTGQVSCSGSGSAYQNGGSDPTVDLEVLTPVAMGTTVPAVAVQAGRDFTVVLMHDGTAMFFGGNNYGQAGNGNTVTARTPEAFAHGIPITGMDVGLSFIMFFGPDKVAKVVGRNDHGACGQGSLTLGGFSTPVTLDISGSTAPPSPTRHVVTARPTHMPSTRRPTMNPTTSKPTTLRPTRNPTTHRPSTGTPTTPSPTHRPVSVRPTKFGAPTMSPITPLPTTPSPTSQRPVSMRPTKFGTPTASPTTPATTITPTHATTTTTPLPTKKPSRMPTSMPTRRPTRMPTSRPTRRVMTSSPTESPTQPVGALEYEYEYEQQSRKPTSAPITSSPTITPTMMELSLGAYCGSSDDPSSSKCCCGYSCSSVDQTCFDVSVCEATCKKRTKNISTCVKPVLTTNGCLCRRIGLKCTMSIP